MASLSASPSGRRLSELLEEKQEPFYLDLHLLEKGCSPRLLDGYDAAAVMCWPAASAAAGGGNDAAGSVLRRLTTTKKKKEAARGGAKKTTKKPAAAAATGLLRVLLSKILHVKAASNRKPAALQSSESFSFKKVAAAAAAASPSPCSTKHHPLDAVEVAAADEKEEEMEYTDSESDDEKQFSPVSVLDHPFDFESSPIHKRSPSRVAQPQGSPKNAMAFVRDLLEAAYSPALLTHLLSKTDDLINATADAASAAAAADDDDDCCYHHESDGGELAPAAAYWEAHRAELTRVSAMVASEVPSSSRISAADVRPERDGVGADLEAAVLDQLLHELAMELAGGR
uniref:Uncharacterized protein n=1 Tax=Oryza glumipatula TaxID=40148 RepID=A0A0E0BK73_9ORYZ